MLMGVFLSVLQSGIIFSLEKLPWLVTWNLFRWVYLWRSLQHGMLAQGDVSSPGHRFPPISPLCSGSGQIMLLEELNWSLMWKKRYFPLYLGGFSVESAVWEAAVGGQEGAVGAGGWSVHANSSTGTCWGCAWELLPAGRGVLWKLDFYSNHISLS